MTRLPLVPLEPADEITAAVFDSFRPEGRDPIGLYRVLAHSPVMLRAYAGLARGLRYEATTPRSLRELMILRTAQLTGSEYEWAHHRAMAAAAGVAQEQVDALGAWQDSDRFDERERAALRCVDEMHEIALSDDSFAALERENGRAGTIELVLLAAFYQAVARMIQALGLVIEPPYARYEGEPQGPAGMGDRGRRERQA